MSSHFWFLAWCVFWGNSALMNGWKCEICADKWLVLKDRYLRCHLHLIAAYEVMALRWDTCIYILLFFRGGGDGRGCVFFPAFVCLSVCLSATSHENCRSELHETITKDVSMDKQDSIEFLEWRSKNWKLCHTVYYLPLRMATPPCRRGLHRSGAIYSWWHHCPSINSTS